MKKSNSIEFNYNDHPSLILYLNLTKTIKSTKRYKRHMNLSRLQLYIDPGFLKP